MFRNLITRNKMLFAGVVLLAASAIWHLVAAWSSQEPPEDYDPIFAGIVQTPLGPRLNLVTPVHNGFVPLSGSLDGGTTIPARRISFDIDAVTSAATPDNVHALRINNTAELIWLSQTTAVGDQKPTLKLETISEGAFTGDFQKISLYREASGNLETQFASVAPVIFWEMADTSQSLFVHYSSAMCGYKWNQTRYVPDRTLKSSHVMEYLIMAFKGWTRLCLISERTILLIVFVIVIWVVRGLRLLFGVKRSRSAWSYSSLLTMWGLLFWLGVFYFALAKMENNYLGLFVFPAMLAWAGWNLIALATLNPPKPDLGTPHCLTHPLNANQTQLGSGGSPRSV